MPRVSVVIATYKRPQALTRAIRSALAQTVSDLEVVVAVEADDALSPEVVTKIGDPRVRHVVNPVKNGPGPARDTAAAASNGDWIAFLDDDDEWMSTKLERQLALAGDQRAIVSTLSNWVTSTGTFVRPATPYDGSRPIDEWLFDRLSWFKAGESMLQTSSLMVPRALMAETSFGSNRHEDWEFAIRAVKQFGYQLLTVREPLVVYYTGDAYPWRGSLDWIEQAHTLLSDRATAGFCLTVAVQGLTPPDRGTAFIAFLRTAFRLGKPTARQLFAFALIWAVPNRRRAQLRALFRAWRRRT